MKKKHLWITAICLAILFVAGITTAWASEVMPCADTEFISATTTLKSSKQVSFRSITHQTKGQLSVVACWLEKQNTDGSWFYVCSMTPPSTVYTNTSAYSASKDYSNYIGTGTYRVWATYDADGHRISRCSNERTF